MTEWRMRIACWIAKATNTHSECVIFIALSLQQCLHERTSMLHCLSCVCYIIERGVWLQPALTANLMIICIFKINVGIL